MEKEALALRDAIEVADCFWREYTNKNKSNICWKVFVALVEQTKSSSALEANEIDECYFNTKEMTEKLEELADKKPNSYDGNRLAKEYKNLLIRLDEVEIRLIEIANELGKSVIPWVEKSGNSGGQGKQTSYRLTAKQFSAEQVRNSSTAQAESKDEIHYYVESAPKLPLWARWMQHIDMDKHRWPVLFFTMSPVVIGMIGVVQFFLAKYGVTSLYNGWLLQAAILYPAMFLLLFKHFITAINHNIALIPNWMLPIHLQSAVLQYDLNEPGSDRVRLKSLNVRVYSAKCPICGHRVHIKAKGFPFKERLISECDLNPVEHKFSFDFTNLTGRKLIR